MISNTTAENATETLSESIFELMGTFKILFDSFKILLDIPFSSEPIMIATDFLKFELYIVSSPFSDRLITSISRELKCRIVLSNNYSIYICCDSCSDNSSKVSCISYSIQ